LMLLPLIFVTAHTATCFCNASPAQWFLCLPGCCDAGLWLNFWLLTAPSNGFLSTKQEWNLRSATLSLEATRWA
jgi:hypothetical protein